ncbi:MAG: type pilus assembly protein PilY1 [Synergistales bacterium]|nr:type pilus assembly protein PilY1 [Synergistales bacterium]
MKGKRKSRQSARWLIYYTTVALVYGLLSCTPALATNLSIYKIVENPVPSVGDIVTFTAEIEKGEDFEESASTSIMVQGEPSSVSEIFTPFYKPVPPLFENNIQPNVLLLIDTSGSMTFNMFNDNSTYGDGSGPAYGFSSPWFDYDYGPQFYYGEDTDDSNNDPGREHNYHPGMKYILQSDIDLIVAKRGSAALNWLGHTDNNPPEGGYSKYLHPNDSRMYQTKLVLNEIFSDQQLISGLRVALATYDQNYTSSGARADWYAFHRDSGTELLHYTTGNARAKLREGFGSTDDPSHLAGLVRWFDGVEEGGNHELRAQGGTPLAASIYGARSFGWGLWWTWDWDKEVDSAVKFFMEEGVIEAWCQKNYLIVLTDGANTEIGDPVTAVKKLYDEAEIGDWPEHFGRKSLPVKTLVIGLINPEEMEDLADTLNEMADYGWDGEEGNADTSDDPFESGDPGAYFAGNLDELLAAFQNIFALIQADQTTGGAPMVSPARTEAGESSVYVASFLPQNYTQWKGHLRRYEISSDGELDDTPEWDAAEILERGEPSARQVCTIDWTGSVASKTTSLGSHTNFVDFDEGNASALAEEMFPEGYVLPADFVDFVSKFINWFRGSDEWNEAPTSLYRYAFPDIYHGGVTEVGPPIASYPSETYDSFKADNRDRDKVLYLQSNAGLLHAINLNDDAGEDPGGEKWAFIPPNALARGRLLGLKAYYSNDGTVDLLDETPSVPRYLLDGPLVAEDVVMSEGWCTVLLGCTGYGGHGMYALDVTDPDEPRFLWAVENNVISPDGSLVLGTDSRKIHYWKKESGLQVYYQNYTHEKKMNDDDKLDYRQLYRTLSTPLIAYTRSVTEDDGSWEGRWIAAMGNGHPGDFTDTFNEGFVYMIDIENGEILRKLEVLDRGENVLKPVAAPVSGFSSSIATRILDHLYAADIEGDVYNWSASREQWEEALQIFDAPEDEAGVTYRMDVGMINGDPWLFYQTGDMENLNYAESVFRIYALNTTEAIEGYPLKIDDLQELTPTGSTTSTGYEGWYMNFEDDPLEIPSTPVTFYNGYLLFATFVESDDPCKNGDSKIYLVNARTGEGTWENGKRFVQLSGLQISGITIFDDRVYLGVVGMATQGDLPDALGQDAMLAQNLLSFKLPEEVPSSEDGGGGTNPGLIFWKEWRDRQ